MVEKITLNKSKKYIKVSNLTKSNIGDVMYFTINSSKDGWDKITYYTSTKNPLK